MASSIQSRRSPLRPEAADARACTLESRRRVLREIPFFQALPAHEIQRTSEVFWERGFHPGEVIYYQGEPATHLYVLTLGKVRVERSADERPNALLDIFGPGDFFGTLPALGSTSYADTATALTAGCALVIAAREFQTILERYPSVTLAILQHVTARLEAAYAEIEHLNAFSLDQRVASTLRRLADKFGDARGDDLLIQVPLTRRDLAAMTGATLESVSRVVSRFRRSGLIRSGRGWIAIRDVDHLAAVAR